MRYGKKMRVLMVSANYPPRVGGPSSTVPSIIIELSKREVQCIVLTSSVNRRFEHKKTEFGHIYRVPELIPNAYYSFVATLLRLAFLSIYIPLLVARHEIDLIHAHDFTISGLSGFLGNKISKKPSIIKQTGDIATEISLIKEGSDKKQHVHTLLSRIIFAFGKCILKGYTLVHAPSGYQKERVLKMGIPKDRIVVIPNGITNSIPSKNIKKKDFLFTACRFVPWKGLKYLIAAMPFVFREYPIKLIIAGDGPHKKELEKQVESMGLDHSISFVGNLTRTKTLEYIKNAKIYILPSIYEPAPNALLETLMYGTPIIATKVGGIPEIIRDGREGILIEPRNPIEIAEGVIKLLQEKKTYRRIVNNGKKRVLEYRWSRIIPKLINTYQLMLKKSQH